MEIDWSIEDRGFVFVDILDERRDSAFLVEFRLFLLFAAGIFKDNFQAGIKESEFSETGWQGFKLKFGFLEDFRIGNKGGFWV